MTAPLTKAEEALLTAGWLIGTLSRLDVPVEGVAEEGNYQPRFYAVILGRRVLVTIEAAEE